jgi:hypothetical protein
MRIAYEGPGYHESAPTLVQNATRYTIGRDKLDSQGAGNIGPGDLPRERAIGLQTMSALGIVQCTVVPRGLAPGPKFSSQDLGSS